jgi:hypothetical protein
MFLLYTNVTVRRLQGNVGLDAASMACLWMTQVFKRGGTVAGVSVALPESLSNLTTAPNGKQPLTEVTHIALLPMHDRGAAATIVTGLHWTGQPEDTHSEMQSLLRTGERRHNWQSALRREILCCYSVSVLGS